jgi:hypothetical protein
VPCFGKAVAGFTAGWELHPAPKTLVEAFILYRISLGFGKPALLLNFDIHLRPLMV